MGYAQRLIAWSFFCSLLSLFSAWDLEPAKWQGRREREQVESSRSYWTLLNFEISDEGECVQGCYYLEAYP